MKTTMKKRIFAIVAIMVIAMTGLTGCGKAGVLKSMTMDETVDYARFYGADVIAEEVVEEDEAIVEEDIVVEDEAAEEDNVVAEETESTETAAFAQPSQSMKSTQSTKPAHTHNWKEHWATTQTWIPNIVVVDDYETQTVKWEEYTCYCGFTTTDPAVIDQHIMSNVRAGEPGTGRELAGGNLEAWIGDDMEHGGFTGKTHVDSQQIKVGSHEEDLGGYATISYVDYYYCDCGATK